MTRELFTCWTDYQAAVERLLAAATHRICLYDDDLAPLKLDSPARHTNLQRLLQGGRSNTVQIAVRNASTVRERHPMLLRLLEIWGHAMAIQESPAHLGDLRDSMILVDNRHALIRFERELPRSKLLLDDPDAVRPYSSRFDGIWAEGGEKIAASTLGL